MKVLIGPDWKDRVDAAARKTGVDVEWLIYDNDHRGPFPGVEVILRSWRVSDFGQILDNCPDLKWMHTPSAGVNSIVDVTGPRGLRLTESGRAYRICIGEFVIAQMYFVAKRLGPLWEKHQQRRWDGEPMRDLTGATVGIVGLGPIGLGVAERALGVGMRVIGCRRSGAPIENVTEVVTPDKLPRLMHESDYIVIACPLTEQTRGMIDAKALAGAKDTAWLLNIARGAIVDTDALMDALNKGRLGGACLDVTDPEPLPEDHPLWRCPNVFITPHTSSGDAESSRRIIAECFVENLRRWQAGEPLRDEVDYDRGY